MTTTHHETIHELAVRYVNVVIDKDRRHIWGRCYNCQRITDACCRQLLATGREIETCPTRAEGERGA